MEKQLKLALASITNFWKSLTRRLKIIIMVGLVAVILLAVGVNIYLNTAQLPDGYSILYRNVSTEEAATIYTSLKSQGYSVIIDDEYNVLVNENEVELARMEMAAVGLPTTALTYDTFTNNSGFLTTELERKSYLIFQLQDRIIATLERIDGIESAAVTLTEGEDDEYAWSSSARGATASVGLTLRYKFSLAPDQVRAIKYLVANSVPNLEYDDVVVIDLGTSILLSDEEILANPDANSNEVQLAFQKSYEENMENKIRQLLSPIYGAENVAVAATVQLDFDKMLSEETIYTPSGDQNTGVIDYLEQFVGSTGSTTASGVVGEEDNTDIAIYPTLYDENGDLVEENHVVDYLVSYITTQVEKNQAKLISASISVIIRNDNEMTQELMDALTANVAAAVNLSTSNVIVNSFPKNATDVPIIVEPEPLLDTTTMIIIGIVLVLLIALIIVVLRIRKKARLKRLAEQQAAEDAERAALLAEKERLERERQLLAEQQQEESNKFKGTIDNIKEFAHDNPAIAASLIKEWLREGGDH